MTKIDNHIVGDCSLGNMSYEQYDFLKAGSLILVVAGECVQQVCSLMK